MSDSGQDQEDTAWARRHRCLCKAELSALYHQKRERFFELWDKLSKAVAVIGGSAALYKVGDAGTVQVIAAAITVTSALGLVFSFSERSRRHAELAKSFRQIIAEIMAKGDFESSFNDADINGWRAKLYALEASEPPTLSALTVLCQNELAIAQGHKVDRTQGFWKRKFAHFFDMPLTS